MNSCTSSTARQYAPTGTCMAGTCTYAFVDTSCPSGCAAGSCNAPTCGTTTCNTPPTSSCTSSTVMRSYATVGECDAGSCSYQPRTTTCSLGCFNGACIAGSWEREHLDFNMAWTSVSMAIDALGQTHLASADNRGNVVYTFDTATGWKQETVDPSLGFGTQVALALKNGQPLIAYYEPVNRDLRFAERTAAGTWNKLLVASTDDVGRAVSIAVDATGAPVISFLDGDTAQAATRTNTGWSFATIGGRGARTQLQLDSSGTLHAIMGEQRAFKLSDATTDQPTVWYAVRNDDAGWDLRELDPDGMLGPRSMAPAAGGGVQILYGVVHRPNMKQMYGPPEELRRAWFTQGVRRDEVVHQFPNLNDVRTHPNGFWDVSDEPGISWGATNERRFEGSYYPAYDGGTVLDVLPGPTGRGQLLVTEQSYSPWYTNSVVREPRCTPSCSGKACGPDGCGGNCGQCTAGTYCSYDGTCGTWERVTVPLDYGCNRELSTSVSTGGSAVHAALFCYEPAYNWPPMDGNTVHLATSGTPLEFSQGALAARQVRLAPQMLATTPGGVPTLAFGMNALLTPDGLGGFTQTPITGAPTGANWPALIIDTQGHHHLSYKADEPDGGRAVFYANDVSGSWVHSRVTSSISTQQDWDGAHEATALAIDGQGKAHIAYLIGLDTRGFTFAVGYASNVTGTFVAEPNVDPSYTFSLNQNAYGRPHVQVAVSSTGQPAVGYGASKVAMKTGSMWTVEQLPNPDTDFSLAVEPGGTPVAVTGFPFRLWRRTGANAWVGSPLPSQNSADLPWLRLDAAGKPVIIYWDQRYVDSVPILKVLRQH